MPVFLHIVSVFKRLEQSYLVGVFEVVAYAQASCQDGDVYGARRGVGCSVVAAQCRRRFSRRPVEAVLQASRDVEACRVALHRRVEGEDDLADGPRRHTLAEGVDLQVGRADAVHRADESAENVVKALELAGGLDGHHVLHILYDAPRRTVAP